jgi:hypothetical protein
LGDDDEEAASARRVLDEIFSEYVETTAARHA